jgi:hypothetical protein
MAAFRGRIHDRSPIACRNTKKPLAERGPSIHDVESSAQIRFPYSPRTNFFIIFVDGIFTTFIEWLFTNVFDAVRENLAISCV